MPWCHVCRRHSSLIFTRAGRPMASETLSEADRDMCDADAQCACTRSLQKVRQTVGEVGWILAIGLAMTSSPDRQGGWGHLWH